MNSIGKHVKKNSDMYFQTLKGHTEDSLKILKTYIDRNEHVIGQFCQRWGLKKESFIRSLFYTIYFHDIGKLTDRFQKNINSGKSSQNHPHAFFGFYLLKDLQFPQLLDNIPIEISAILGHHTQLYNGIYDGAREYKKPTYLENEILNFIEESKNVYTRLGFDAYFNYEEPRFLKNIPRYRPISALKFRKYVINTTDNTKHLDAIKLKSIFSYLFSILQTCDDYSSAEFFDFIQSNSLKDNYFGSILKDGSKYVPKLQINKPLNEILGDIDPYKYQQEIYDNAEKKSILFAPCGRGKTEAALLWSVKTISKYKRNKIIFAMPTQATSNAMYDRMCNLFGKDKVGLFHGRSYIKLKSSNEESNFDEEIDIEQIKDETFKGKTFFKPVNITTIDHLIYSFVHGFSQADFALGNLQNSIIVFDEVHYYEKTTLEHLITLFKMLTEFDIPHLLMSGTIPEFIKNYVNQYSNYKLIEDGKGLSFRPFYLNFENDYLINDAVNPKVIDEITKNYNSGLNQFIILNTIERAKKVYQRITSELRGSEDLKKIVLYHSQFTFNDRIEKENEIITKNKKKPFILIATQVIEISLDISCDIMYTELAPPDALGQRAGRLNRKGKIPDDDLVNKLKIYLPKDELPYEQSLICDTLDEIYKYDTKPCSYRDIKYFCDFIYNNSYKDGLQVPTNLNSVMKKCTIFGYQPSHIIFDEENGKMIQVRELRNQKVEVIPENRFEELQEKALSVEYEAKIPLWWIKQKPECFYTQCDYKGKPFIICNFSYNYNTGFNYGQ
ncbi:MAG: CRISPR-associated helicase Cas3' [Candidatus Woesearchaeota archaeon]